MMILERAHKFEKSRELSSISDNWGFIPIWINFNPSMDKYNYIHFKVWDGQVISPNTFMDMWLLSHAGINVKPC